MKTQNQESTPKEIGWFKQDQKPNTSRPGVYKTRAKYLGVGFSYWGGMEWGNQRKTPEDALDAWLEFGKSCEQSKEWAGLSHE